MYGTWTVEPSTAAYTEPARLAAVHALGTAATATELVVSVAVYPSGAVTMTENVTGPEAGAVYVDNATECVPAVYT